MCRHIIAHMCGYYVSRQIIIVPITAILAALRPLVCFPLLGLLIFTIPYLRVRAGCFLFLLWRYPSPYRCWEAKIQKNIGQPTNTWRGFGNLSLKTRNTVVWFDL